MTLRSLAAHAVWLTGVLAALPGCSGDEDPAVAAKKAALAEGCLINTDCASPLVCVFRRCHQQCKADRDCPSGERCTAAEKPYAVCLLPDESSCSRNSDCPEPLICAQDALCSASCKTERDCLVGQACDAGRCRETGGTTPVPGQMMGMLGATCAYNSDCVPGLVCREGACSKECVTNADCDGFHACKDGACKPINDKGVVYCTPGEQRACDCLGGTKGTQTCVDDGTKLGPCMGCP